MESCKEIMKIFFYENYCCHDNRISKTCKKVCFKMFYSSDCDNGDRISFAIFCWISQGCGLYLCVFFFITSVQVSHYMFPDEIVDVRLACLHMTCTVIDSCLLLSIDYTFSFKNKFRILQLWTCVGRNVCQFLIKDGFIVTFMARWRTD